MENLQKNFSATYHLMKIKGKIIILIDILLGQWLQHLRFMFPFPFFLWDFDFSPNLATPSFQINIIQSLLKMQETIMFPR